MFNIYLAAETFKMPIYILEIPQNADSLGRVLDNFGKDFRTVAIGGVGVGDSAEVYTMKVLSNFESDSAFLIIRAYRKLIYNAGLPSD